MKRHPTVNEFPISQSSPNVQPAGHGLLLNPPVSASSVAAGASTSDIISNDNQNTKQQRKKEPYTIVPLLSGIGITNYHMLHLAVLQFASIATGVHTFVIIFLALNPVPVCRPEAVPCEPPVISLDQYCLEPLYVRKQYQLVSGSLVLEWDIACNHRWLINLVGVCYFFGSLVGTLLVGSLSDSFGRRIGFLTSAIALSLFSVLGMWKEINTFFIFLFVRFLHGAGCGALFLVVFVYESEWFDSSSSTLIGCLNQVGFALGYIGVVVIAYLWPNWEDLCLIPAILAALLVPWGFWFAQESPRWLVSQGRNDDALSVLKSIAVKKSTSSTTSATLKSKKNEEKGDVDSKSAAESHQPAVVGSENQEDHVLPSTASNSTTSVNIQNKKRTNSQKNNPNERHHLTGEEDVENAIQNKKPEKEEEDVTCSIGGGGGGVIDLEQLEFVELVQSLWITVVHSPTSSAPGQQGEAVGGRKASPWGKLCCASNNSGGSGGRKFPATLSILLRAAVLWGVQCCSYYGLSTSAEFIEGSIYRNSIWLAVMEVPAQLLVQIAAQRYGNKRGFLVLMALGVIGCAGFLIVPFAKKFLIMMAQLGVTAAFSLLYVYTSETFPTEVRSVLVGMCSSVGRLGAMASFMLRDMGKIISPGFPIVCWGLGSLLSLMIMYTLPSQIGVKPPETVDEFVARHSGKHRSSMSE